MAELSDVEGWAGALRKRGHRSVGSAAASCAGGACAADAGAGEIIDLKPAGDVCDPLQVCCHITHKLSQRKQEAEPQPQRQTQQNNPRSPHLQGQRYPHPQHDKDQQLHQSRLQQQQLSQLGHQIMQTSHKRWSYPLHHYIPRSLQRFPPWISFSVEAAFLQLLLITFHRIWTGVSSISRGITSRRDAKDSSRKSSTHVVHNKIASGRGKIETAVHVKGLLHNIPPEARYERRQDKALQDLRVQSAKAAGGTRSCSTLSAASFPSWSLSATSHRFQRPRAESPVVPMFHKPLTSLMPCMVLLVLFNFVATNILYFNGRTCIISPVEAVRPPRHLQLPADSPLAVSYLEKSVAARAHEPGEPSGAAAIQRHGALEDAVVSSTKKELDSEVDTGHTAALAAEDADIDGDVAAVLLLQRDRGSHVISAWGAPLRRQGNFTSPEGVAALPPTAAAAFFSSSGSRGCSKRLVTPFRRRETSAPRASYEQQQKQHLQAVADEAERESFENGANAGTASGTAVFVQATDDSDPHVRPFEITTQRKTLLISLLCVIGVLLIAIVAVAIFCYASHLRKFKKYTAAAAFEEVPAPFMSETDSGTSRTGVSSSSSRRNSDMSAEGGSAEELPAGWPRQVSGEEQAQKAQKVPGKVKDPGIPKAAVEHRNAKEEEQAKDRDAGELRRGQLPVAAEEFRRAAPPAGEAVPGSAEARD